MGSWERRVCLSTGLSRGFKMVISSPSAVVRRRVSSSKEARPIMFVSVSKGI